MKQNTFAISYIGPSGAIRDLTLSPETAAKRNPQEFMKLYAEMRIVANRLMLSSIRQMEIFPLEMVETVGGGK